MSLTWLFIYFGIVYVIFNSWRALAWLLKLVLNEPAAYEIVPEPDSSRCMWCGEFEYTEKVAVSDLCWDCATRLPVNAWETVSIWHA